MLVPTKHILSESVVGRRQVVILGSTGSIGRSALELIASAADRFEVHTLVAGSNAELLAEQVRRFRPRAAVIADTVKYGELRKMCSAVETELLAGDDAVLQAAQAAEADVVLAAMVGFAGLHSVLAALGANRRVALANKESLVSGGSLVNELLSAGRGELIPVDSEHSAVFQAMQGERRGEVRRLLLTASGGPFLSRPQEQFGAVTVKEALKHPRWSMGAKISIDSATLMNKALELIEAHWLFAVPQEAIEVIVHPQSIVHSLVEYVDGSQIAQLSVPDMKGAISYALSFPDGRVWDAVAALDLCSVGQLDFLPLDQGKFRAIALARAALKGGGGMPAVLNAANEAAVRAFMDGKITFDRIVCLVEDALELFSGSSYRTFTELKQLHDQVAEAIYKKTQ